MSEGWEQDVGPETFVCEGCDKHVWGAPAGHDLNNNTYFCAKCVAEFQAENQICGLCESSGRDDLGYPCPICDGLGVLPASPEGQDG